MAKILGKKRHVLLSLCALTLCWSCLLPAAAQAAEAPAVAMDETQSIPVPEEAVDPAEPGAPEKAPGTTPADPEEPVEELPEQENAEEQPPEAEQQPGGNSALGQSGTSESDTPSEPDTPSESDAPSEPDESSESDTQSEPDALPVETYTVTLGDCRIGAGELYSYTTISPSYAGSAAIEGYYPGALTVELTGQIVVEAGGSLAIGTLSVGGPEEHPVLTGSGQILVEPGGSLQLTGTSLAGTGEGPMIVQEPGGSVVFQGVETEEGQVQWAAPLVNNLYDGPDDLWLEVGTALSEDMLPATLAVDVQDRGEETRQEVALSWDMGAYDGRTQGELTMTGSFLDQDGEPLASAAPLELTVHWYAPETLVVTDAAWKGETVPTVQLTVQNLPEFAEIWGEVSTDGGETWTRWEDPETFFIVPVEPEGSACLFRLPDETARWFRIVAQDPWEHLYWRSDTFYLCHEEQEDSGGNRGGSINLIAPNRQPEAPEDDGTAEGVGTAEPEKTLGSVSTGAVPEEQVVTQSAELEEPVPVTEPADPTPAEKPQTVVQTPESAVTDPETSTEAGAPAAQTDSEPSEPDAPQQTAPEEAAESLAPEGPAESIGWEESSDPAPAALPAKQEKTEKGTALPVPVQILLVVAGIAVSIAAGLAAARVGPFRKRS